ncbi:hypothetical protein [Rosistilla oblonga]|uniref:hypothetical protein n=1 Tax=Rosistilla oblonga TaxID=2527990 RepID=UPI003A975BDD
MNEPGTLVKFGHKNHIRKLLDEGELYLNNLPYFWEVEDGLVRGDANDGVDALHRGTQAKMFKKDGTEIPAHITSWVIREHTAAETKNILCMYSLRKSTSPIDDRVLDFGDTSLRFTQPEVFYERLCDAVSREKLDFHGDLVEYVPDSHTGDVGLFRKLAAFTWQAEWRFVVYNGSGGPLTINLGPLNDIAEILPTRLLIEESKDI